MKLKSLFLATAAFLAVGAAQAAPIVLDLSSGFADFSSDLASQEYAFTLNTDIIGDGSVTATFGNKSGYVISGIVFNGTPLVADVSGPKFSNYTLFDGPLSAGTYSFTVNGLSKGGSYTGRIDVSSVPEPESFALVLAGLGVAGVLNARRRKSV
jgi:hypothetical protein